ncbi:MAG: hypothetical protein DRP01_03060 [Archaeoglobales archaeon]|nr:MAG: hypothetical protein DRP01_03060 [Archaeoglobales archaeon]
MTEEFIPLDQFGKAPQEKPKRVKQEWKFVRGLGFYTQTGAMVRINLLRGSVDGTQLISIDKGKQRLALLPNDANKLASAIQKVLQGDENHG